MTPEDWDVYSRNRIAQLEDSVIRLVAAMKEAEKIGCVDHLDCADDGGNFWYWAIAEAQDLLDEDD